MARQERDRQMVSKRWLARKPYLRGLQKANVVGGFPVGLEEILGGMEGDHQALPLFKGVSGSPRALTPVSGDGAHHYNHNLK
jgi:hypothetical protein